MSAYSPTTTMPPAPPRERVELMLGQLDELPALPAVAVRLLTITASDSASIRDVIEIIETDAALTATILRMVRRADLGISQEVTSVAQAVKLLGFTAVRNAVLSLQIFEALAAAETDKAAATLRRELWKHALAVACAADMLAAHAHNRTLAAKAFVCGLLHDIGKMALEAVMPKGYARVASRVTRQRASICDAEHEIFGLDHTVAGKRLVTHWQLPPFILETVWLHHHDVNTLPSHVAHPDLIRLVHLADEIVRVQRIGFSGYQHVGSVESLAADLGIERGGLDIILQALPERMEPLCQLVGLDEQTSKTLYAESLAKANRELGRVNADVVRSNRRLKIRSGCFDGLARFTKRLVGQDGIGPVCAAAAEAVCTGTGADQAVALVLTDGTRCAYIGRAVSPDAAPSHAMMDARCLPVGSVSELLPSDANARGVAHAHANGDAVWHRCTGEPTPGPLMALPIVQGGKTLGVMLFCVELDAADQLLTAVADMEVFSAAIGLAVGSAFARQQTDRMNEELVDLNRRLRDAQRELIRARSIAMIGEVAGGAAHEINNPLTVIRGRAQMALADCDDPKQQTVFQTIADKAEEASKIVTDLMSFAKPSRPAPATLALADVLGALSQHWRSSSSLGDKGLTVSLADQDLTVFADADQLRDILDALLANALEATDPESARVQVNSPSLASDDTIQVVIEDNGVGMAQDVLEQAIAPFYSNRPAGRGRGLGLSRAVRLAEVNGGQLWLESTPGMGTTATLILPARAPAA